MSKNLKPVVVLSAICLVVAVLIGVINMITAPEMERQLKLAADKAKAEVLSSADISTFSEDILSELKATNPDIPNEINAIYKADTGYVFQASVSGNASGMIIMCGISNDGKITGVKDVANGETPSFWATVTHLLGGENSSYTGSSVDGLSAQLVSGATKSSTGIYNAVKLSVKAFNLIKGNDVTEDEEEPTVEDTTTPKVDRDDEEILTLVNEMYDGAITVDMEKSYIRKRDYKPEQYRNVNMDPTTLGVYRNSIDESVVFHLATRTSYRDLETEAMILVDGDGKVLKVNILNWLVGHKVNYTPEFLNSFIGKNKYHTGDIDIVAGATGTSDNLIIALKNALFDEFGTKCITEEEIDELAYRVIPYDEKLENMALPENAPETVKKMYKLESGRGYVFFVYTESENRPNQAETEAFVYTDINGKIMNVYIVSWVVGHTVYSSENYAEGLKGKTIEQLRGNGDDLNPDIDQVAGATGTSAHLEHAIADALTLVPEHTNYSLIGIIAISVAAVLTVSVAVISYVRRRGRI